MTDESRLLGKKFNGLNLGSMGLNQAKNEVSRHLLEFRSYVFLEIAYNDSLRQYLTSSRGKTHEKLGPKFEPNWPKSGPKLGFLPFYQAWFISFLLKCIE